MAVLVSFLSLQHKLRSSGREISAKKAPPSAETVGRQVNWGIFLINDGSQGGPSPLWVVLLLGRQTVLSGIRQQAEQAKRSMAVSVTSLWPLPQFLAPGPYLEFLSSFSDEL